MTSFCGWWCVPEREDCSSAAVTTFRLSCLLCVRSVEKKKSMLSVQSMHVCSLKNFFSYIAFTLSTTTVSPFFLLFLRTFTTTIFFACLGQKVKRECGSVVVVQRKNLSTKIPKILTYMHINTLWTCNLPISLVNGCMKKMHRHGCMSVR